jgi:hypothetical protein
MKNVLFLTLLSGCFFGCSELTNEQEALAQSGEADSSSLDSEAESILMSIEDLAVEYLSMIQQLKWSELSKLNGMQLVLFSPYSYVDTIQAVRLNFDDLAAASRNDVFLTWGISDGEGEPIVMSVDGYFKRFVNDVDYLSDRDEMNVGTMTQRGNSWVNVHDVFPGSTVVEFYRGSRNPDMAEMDWRALGLVFEEIDNQWILVAVVHNEWTI